ncbi:low specificity L-threonine aldolase [Roseovarius sp. EL26]|uniref:threonine aldolase family protein n=1 Tax=Roseovarius sp. EL26 TaxID=2126672 RepID=UPI000EA140A2|nr:beta-eliminating lyase-related protein [Roseovarius sp. EL26]
MNFGSDNCGPAHPAVLDAVIKANSGYQASYGADTVMDGVRAQIREIFEAPEAAVYLVATGTAANSLALSCMAQPWDTVFCSEMAHIQRDECNAPEFYTGGAKLTLAGEGDKLTPEGLKTAITSWVKGDVHVSQRGPLALTQATENGRIYTVAEIEALTTVAKQYSLPTYMDGARFTNALVALGCTPAEMTWKAGVDAVSLGGSKNGCMGVEAVIFFDPSKAWEFELRRKRGAHLFSKHRYLSAQMQGYLTDDLWLATARMANARGAYLSNRLAEVEGANILYEPQVNMIFATLPRATHQKLHAAGAVYGLFEGPLDDGDPNEPLLMRLVCDWSISEAEIDQFIAAAK